MILRAIVTLPFIIATQVVLWYYRNELVGAVGHRGAFISLASIPAICYAIGALATPSAKSRRDVIRQTVLFFVFGISTHGLAAWHWLIARQI